jgi:hypothetical protein
MFEDYKTSIASMHSPYASEEQLDIARVALQQTQVDFYELGYGTKWSEFVIHHKNYPDEQRYELAVDWSPEANEQNTQLPE